MGSRRVRRPAPSRLSLLVVMLFMATMHHYCCVAFCTMQCAHRRSVHHLQTSRQNEFEFDTKNFALAKHTLLRIAAAIMMVPVDVFALSPPMIEPLPASNEEAMHRQAISRALDKGWSTSDGFETPQADEILVNNAMLMTTEEEEKEVNIVVKNKKRPSTYGEVTELGVRQLFFYMKLKDTASMDTDVKFFDMGSGAGKLVVQAYMELPSLSRAVGIELAPSRHAAAIQAWENLESIAKHIRAIGTPQPCRQNAVVELYEGDLFDLDVTEATHMYIASLCFTTEMMQRISEKIKHEAVNMRCVASLQPSISFDETFGKARVEFVEMTWTKQRGQGCPVYFYDTVSHHC